MATVIAGHNHALLGVAQAHCYSICSRFGRTRTLKAMRRAFAGGMPIVVQNLSLTDTAGAYVYPIDIAKVTCSDMRAR